jgi:hypothetical protein
VSAAWSKRLTLVTAGVLVALGFPAASAPSQTESRVAAALDAEIQLVTAGPGTLTISPVEDGSEADCQVDAQQYQVDESSCIHHYTAGTRVVLTATPNDRRHSFAGWSDFKCANASSSCALTLASGTQYITARFTPVTLRISPGEGKFGKVTVTPKASRTCTFDDDSPCEYPSGTVVTLRREHASPGYFWVGACDGNRAGKLDAAACTLSLQSNELVGAGYKDPGEIPPALGSSITIGLGGSGRGTVSGSVINGTQTLNCGKKCTIPGLTRYDHIRLRVSASRGSHFYRWSDLSRQQARVVSLSSTTRIRARFVRN